MNRQCLVFRTGDKMDCRKDLSPASIMVVVVRWLQLMFTAGRFISTSLFPYVVVVAGMHVIHTVVYSMYLARAESLPSAGAT